MREGNGALGEPVVVGAVEDVVSCHGRESQFAFGVPRLGCGGFDGGHGGERVLAFGSLCRFGVKEAPNGSRIKVLGLPCW